MRGGLVATANSTRCGIAVTGVGITRGNRRRPYRTGDGAREQTPQQHRGAGPDGNNLVAGEPKISLCIIVSTLGSILARIGLTFFNKLFF